MLHVILLLLLPLLAPEVCMVAEELLHGQCCHAATVTLHCAQYLVLVR